MLPECMSRYNLIPYSMTVLLLFSADLEMGLNDCPVVWNLNPIGFKILYLALGSVFASKIPAHHSILHMDTLRAKLGEVAIENGDVSSCFLCSSHWWASDQMIAILYLKFHFHFNGICELH